MNYDIGTRVRIIEDCRDEPTANGAFGYLADRIKLTEDGEFSTPLIVLDDGTHILGAECWWEPYDSDAKEQRPLEEVLKELEEYKIRLIQKLLEEENAEEN